MKKKASLSLSINAIVILVLAITMLGLGLGFTKGMFGKLSSKLSVPEPDIPATADDPIVLPVEQLTITKNKDFIFSVNVYNDDFTGFVDGMLQCAAKAPAGELTVSSAPQEIPPGEDKGFKFIIEGEQVTQSVTRICTITFTGAEAGSETKQVVVAIR
ncbi:hypothetical protein KY349_01790 [Candidatus Woesearchaeota archaeon]|nr:hypothetical protein [Candidatus Woesearchaeota archaeon]